MCILVFLIVFAHCHCQIAIINWERLQADKDSVRGLAIDRQWRQQVN